ncbi:MAG: hypothetical protein ABI165_20320 [Bryobacteraceae bacterium]
MDLNKAIHELIQEKRRLDRVIETLEAVIRGEAVPARKARKRRGRRPMSAEERRNASERMKSYWAARRKQNPPVKPSATS